MSTIISLPEVCAGLPLVLQWSLLAMLRKPKGGFRPRGVMPMVYRVFARARRRYAVDWRENNNHDFLCASKGKSPGDVVCRQSVRAEAAVAAGEDAACGLSDMSSFYECFDRSALRARALGQHYNGTILQLCLSIYSYTRFITIGRASAPGKFARNGPIVGCGFADVVVFIYCLLGFKVVVSRNPSVKFAFYFDEPGPEAAGKPDFVVKSVSNALSDLDLLAKKELNCEIAVEKSAVVASTKMIPRTFAAL